MNELIEKYNELNKLLKKYGCYENESISVKSDYEKEMFEGCPLEIMKGIYDERTYYHIRTYKNGVEFRSCSSNPADFGIDEKAYTEDWEAYGKE